MLLMTNSVNTKICKNPKKMTETLANGYSSESTQRELSNEYQHDRVSMVFKDLSILVLWTNVASALEGLRILKHKSDTTNQFLRPHSNIISIQVSTSVFAINAFVKTIQLFSFHYLFAYIYVGL